MYLGFLYGTYVSGAKGAADMRLMLDHAILFLKHFFCSLLR
jgi:hypothetical protein